MMGINKKDVGQRIVNIRNDKGLTLNEFGKEIGKKIDGTRIKEGIISRWENGISLPNNKRLKAIAELGEITVEQLLKNTNPLEKYSDVELLNELLRRKQNI